MPQRICPMLLMVSSDSTREPRSVVSRFRDRVPKLGSFAVEPVRDGFVVLRIDLGWNGHAPQHVVALQLGIVSEKLLERDVSLERRTPPLEAADAAFIAPPTGAESDDEDRPLALALAGADFPFLTHELLLTQRSRSACAARSTARCRRHLSFARMPSAPLGLRLARTSSAALYRPGASTSRPCREARRRGSAASWAAALPAST